MANFPASCSTCGHIFLSGINASNSKNVTLRGNKQNCPSCGGWAEIVEGTFDIDHGPAPTFKQTGGAAVDSELFTRLGLILIQAKLERLKPSEIVEKIGPHSPTLAKRLSAVMDDPQAFSTVLSAIIASFAAVAAAVIASSQPSKPSSIEIHIDKPASQLERDRDDLRQMRENNRPLPTWAQSFAAI